MKIKNSKSYNIPFHSPMRIQVSRARCLCQLIGLVWWDRSLPIGLWRVFYPLFSIATTSSRDFGSNMCDIVAAHLRIADVSLSVSNVLYIPWNLTYKLIWFYLLSRCRRHFRGSSILQTRLKSLSSMDTATFDEKDVICWQSDNSVRYVEVDRVTTVWLPTIDQIHNFAQNCLPLHRIVATIITNAVW